MVQELSWFFRENVVMSGASTIAASLSFWNKAHQQPLWSWKNWTSLSGNMWLIFFLNQTLWLMSIGLEKGDLGPISGFRSSDRTYSNRVRRLLASNTLQLCQTRSCLLISASHGGPQPRSFIWIFSGLMRTRGWQTAGQKNNMIAGDKIMTRCCKNAKVCHTLLCKQSSKCG